MRTPPPDFDLGDHVTIMPMENCPARVVAIELGSDGWTVVVRYFDNSEAKTLKAFPDEIARPIVVACADKERTSVGPWSTASEIDWRGEVTAGTRESGPADG